MGPQRHHVVLVPGFAGFDALGQVHYYAGVTAAYNDWQRKSSWLTPRLELHYFDNLPTAAVTTRAERLGSFLAKRVARGSFQYDPSSNHRSETDEKVILVGHSTGGLDIRRLLHDLRQLKENKQVILVDGDVKVEPEVLLRLISGIVFLSVPQYGTNLADWMISHPIKRKFLAWLAASSASFISKSFPFKVFDQIGDAGAKTLGLVGHGVSALAQGITAIPVIGNLATTVAGLAASLSRKVLPASWFHGPVIGEDLSLAIQDSLRESSQQFTNNDPVKQSKAREAASELQLWLDNIQEDFAAIDDLRNSRFIPDSPASMDPRRSPAHYSKNERETEEEMWDSGQHPIATLSFATLGNRPPPFSGLQPLPDLQVPVWNPLNAVDEYKLHAEGFDSTYLAGYFATAGKRPADESLNARPNFEDHRDISTLKGLDGNEVVKVIESWDNDGIVNTASMLWPNRNHTRLVQGDHGDIIGHYERAFSHDNEEHRKTLARQYLRYDFFVSGDANKFGDDQFRKVWEEIFNFCLNPQK